MSAILDKENSAEDGVVGLRVKDANAFRGTVRYSGTVVTSKKDPSAVWYGVEWDDATRGKHDGAVEADGREHRSRTLCGKSFARRAPRGARSSARVEGRLALLLRAPRGGSPLQLRDTHAPGTSAARRARAPSSSPRPWTLAPP